MLYKAPKAEKPTILLLMDRNELEQQMERNLAMLGIEAVERVRSKDDLEKKLRQDYRGLLICMVQKFGDAPVAINTRKNIYVLIDEAHRTTGGDLGTYLMAALPNATLIGFTGTPIDRTAHGKGTFVTFGGFDDKGYLDRYSIKESIEDQTTLPLYYALAPNELLVPAETLEKEFFALAETEGITDIEELNKVLQKAVVTKNFLKAHQRVDTVAKYVADHFLSNVEPLGYKAFLVGVDREACALYKRAIDKYLPPEYSRVVYTPGENDDLNMKAYYLSLDDEKQVRKDFASIDKLPKILIVTEKLLTGYDAPCLYAMYLDKPMRDHPLLQAIARVNRPYEDEARQLKKPHGLVVDFVGIFDKIEKALAFDSDEIDAIVKDVDVLKGLFAQKMQEAGEQYLTLVSTSAPDRPFTDKDTDNLIEHFRDKSRREEFFKEYAQIELLYEVISPDAFLSPHLDAYALLSKIYQIVRNAFGKRVYVDKEFLRKTENLVKENVTVRGLTPATDFFEINEHTIEQIKNDAKPDNVKIVNLVKSIQKWVDESNNDLVLLSFREKAEAIRERYEDTQANTQEILEQLEQLLQTVLKQKEDQAAKQFDNVSYFVYLLLTQKYYPNPDAAAQEIRDAFIAKPNWQTSERDMRDLRKKVYFALLKHQPKKDVPAATQIVEEFFDTLVRASRQ